MISSFKKSLNTVSWAFYDFANTIYSMNIITLYFALWVTVDKGGEDILYSIAFSVSLILSACLEPVLGAFSDAVGRKKIFMAFFTFVCCVFTALIGVLDRLYIGLLFFVMANLSYQLAAVFYTALLSHVSTQSNIGRVSGLGVGLGYMGTIFGLLTVKPFVNTYGRAGAFIPTAVLFIIFTLPCLIFTKEQLTKKIGFRLRTVWHNSFTRMKATLAEFHERPALKKLFLGWFIFLSMVNTIILFMGVYTKKVMEFTHNEVNTYFIICTLFAIVASFICGMGVDRVGPFKVFRLTLISWIVALLFVLVSFNKNMFWIAGALIGISLSATWVVCRVIIVSLFPQEKLGEMFGFFGFVTKISGILGSLLWGMIILVFEPLGIYKYKIAIFVQVIIVLIALLIVGKVEDQLMEQQIEHSKEN